MLVLKITSWVLACVISAILYRAGGEAQNPDSKPKWIPMWLRQSWVRDWLCPLCVSFALLLCFVPSVWYGWICLLISYGLLGGSLSTYWDFLFGYDNFWFSGFMCGLALLPMAFCGIAWWVILFRAVTLSICWGQWCKTQSNDVIEEMGRGAFLVLSMLALLI